MLQAKTEEQKLHIMQIAQKFAEGHVFVRDNHIEFDGSIIEYDGMAEIVDYIRKENEVVEIPTMCHVSADSYSTVYCLYDTPHEDVIQFCKKLAWVKGKDFGYYYEQFIANGRIVIQNK
jgi:hypothetical protein